MSYFNAFFHALTLLTCFPIPKTWFSQVSDSQVRCLSSVFYPVVGLLIGTLLLLCFWLLPLQLNDSLRAFVLLSFWVFITGALHLDGLADCVDAMFVAHRDESLVLDVLKDPHIGAMAAICLNLLLLLKFILIASVVIDQGSLLVLILAPALARLAAVFYMMSTPYVRESGMASGLNVTRYTKIHVTFAVAIGVFVASQVSIACAVLIFTILTLVIYYWRRYWMAKINGYTGDCVGALIEIVEVSIMAIFMLG